MFIIYLKKCFFITLSRDRDVSDETGLATAGGKSVTRMLKIMIGDE